MMVDPLGIPFLQKALGGGQITEQELQEIMKGAGSPFQPGMGNAMGGAAMGAASPQIGQLGMRSGPAPIPMPQMMGSSDQPGSGPSPGLLGALEQAGRPIRGLFSGPASFDAGSGNWTPGAQGFPMPGGGGPGMMARLGGMLGGK